MHGSSDYEKGYAINEVLNKSFIAELDKNYSKHQLAHQGKESVASSIVYDNLRRLKNVYKYRPVFSGDKPHSHAAFFEVHSILAYAVIDSPETENQSELVTNLRETHKKLLELANNDKLDKIEVKPCKTKYNHIFDTLLKHIIVSDIRLNNINSSFIKEGLDSTYTVRKRS